MTDLKLVQTAPPFDKDNCIRLGLKMDASAAGKKKATIKELDAYDACIVHYNCHKAMPSQAPSGAYDTSESRMRYLIQMCGDRK